MEDDQREKIVRVRPKSTTRSFTFYEGDLKLIGWAAEFLGCSRSEFVRSAIRGQATQLQQIAKKMSS